MNPNIWGPPTWEFLHSITLNYPVCPNEVQKNNIKNFFNNLQSILPCEKCQLNYKQHLIKSPLTDQILSSRTTLIRWLFDIHNEVNISTGKKVITFEYFLEKYNRMYSGTSRYITPLNILIFFIVFVLIILSLLYLFFRS